MANRTVTPAHLAILAALQPRVVNLFGNLVPVRPDIRRKHVYGGTTAEHVIAKRRARNKAARVSRRINRAGR